MKNTWYIIFVLIGWGMGGCGDPLGGGLSLDTSLRPKYLPYEKLHDIRNVSGHFVENTGAVFLINDYFFVLENLAGIHVYDVSDSTKVSYLTFIQIPAVGAFTVYGDIMYAHQYKDLLTIDVSDIYDIKLVTRQEGLFSPLLYPEGHNGYFECVDEALGAVVGWEPTTEQNLQCRTL